MPSNNIQRGTANADPSSNDIDSEPRPLLLKYNLSLLYSILYNNGDSRYKKMRFGSSK